MRLLFLLFISFTLSLISCKNDKQSGREASDEFITNSEVKAEVQTSPTQVLSKELYAKLDRLKIRTDSTMGAKTAIVISEGDTLIYQDDFSTQRENLKLRGKNYYEPWLKVLHPQSGKMGWVYGGAVKYDSPALKQQHDKASPLLVQLQSDDLEWNGTVPTGWSTASITNPKDFKLFLIRFKGMVANNDVDALSNLVQYPLKEIKNKADFKANFSRLFSDNLKEAVDVQRLDRIYRNNKGAMIGDEHLWFKQFGNSYKIVSIDFKGVADIAKELMNELAGNYMTTGPDRKSVKAFRINKFLELTLNFKNANDFPDSRTLGRYKHLTSYNGKHTFAQDTKDSIKRKLVFELKDSIYNLRVENDLKLQGDVFIK